jgi:NADH:ubiquinone oxidoreductase subunit 6 (subunit J)
VTENSNAQAAQVVFTLPATARALGYAGLLPFIASAAACWLTQGATKAFAQQALLTYGAVIVSFLGAVHWGVSLAQRSAATWPYAWSITPSLLAWLALLLPFSSGTVLLSLALIACWLVDKQTLRSQVFGLAYLQLRTHLTVVALLCIVAGRLAG